MAEQVFTRAEAEALLPQIAPLLRELQSAWADLVDTTTAATLLRQRMLGNGHALIPTMRGLNLRLEEARLRVATLMNHIQAFGCDLKDPTTGLIDFPAQMFGRVVWLCWRLGETGIDWWHELDVGFAGRQPLDP